MRRFPRFWLQRGPRSALLWPLSVLFLVLSGLRRRFFRHGLLRSYRLALPVIVVGNIFVGGTGKTPFVIWLAQRLSEQGWRPGVVTRGYGGNSKAWPQRVEPDSDPAEVGDEPVLLAANAACPVVVDPDRSRGGAYLHRQLGCDIVISDDGLQHYRLQRDLELVVIDGERGLGNGRCLPAGPLREPPSRLAAVDLVLINGPSAADEHGFELQADLLRCVSGQESAEFNAFAGRVVHAVAGIGNPGRFFESLRQQGVAVIEHAFPDHYAYRPQDLVFGDDRPIIMTEKDAVKCRRFAPAQAWYVPVHAVPTPPTVAALDSLIASLREGEGA